MTIQLKPEQEQLINRAIQAGPISGADEVVDVGVETIRQRLEARQSGTTLNAKEWSRQLDAGVHSQFDEIKAMVDEHAHGLPIKSVLGPFSV